MILKSEIERLNSMLKTKFSRKQRELAKEWTLICALYARLKLNLTKRYSVNFAALGRATNVCTRRESSKPRIATPPLAKINNMFQSILFLLMHLNSMISNLKIRNQIWIQSLHRNKGILELLILVAKVINYRGFLKFGKMTQSSHEVLWLQEVGCL